MKIWEVNAKEDNSNTDKLMKYRCQTNSVAFGSSELKSRIYRLMSYVINRFTICMNADET